MIRRNRLTEQISVEPRGNWLIEAGAGYGKSALINELKSSLPDPLVLARRNPDRRDLDGLLQEVVEAARRTGIADLAEEFAAADGSAPRVASVLIAARCSIAFDDVHQWNPEVGDFVLRLAGALTSSPSAMLVVGRDLPISLASLRTDSSWRVLTATDLALTIDEIAEMLASRSITDRAVAASVHELTDGWPAAVAAVCARLGADPTAVASELARYDSLVDGLMHGYLDDVEDDDLAAGRTLAMLPFFDDHVAELAGSPGLVERLAAAGIPITRQADGWAELPEQFRASLIRSSPPTADPTIDPRIIDHFGRRGEIQAAINACLAIGDNLAAAKIIAGASYAQESHFDPVALNAAMTTIGDVADQAPRSLLVQAQVNVSHGAFNEGLVCIERAEAIANAAGADPTDPVHLEILLELGVWRHFSGREIEARRLLERCEAALPGLDGESADSFLANRARLLDLQGLLSTDEGSKESLETARLAMTEALAIWRRLQEPRAATATALRLVSDVLVGLGRRQEALATLDSLPSIGPMTLVNRARVQLQRARLLPYLGQVDQANEAIAEARSVATLVGHDWLLAMAGGHEATAASFTGDIVRVTALCTELEAHPDRFVTSADEGLTWCLVADAFARCGKFERAAELLARARTCEGVHQSTYEFSDLYLQAQSGDPAKASSMLEQLAVTGVMPERQWALALLQALCAYRQGDIDNADKYLQASFDEAAVLGDRSLPVNAERQIVELIRTRGAPADSDLPADVARVVMVQLFDGFGVTIDGAPLTLPGGQITDLVKLMVLSNGRLVVDQAIDHLWPEAELAVGRPRLRNVLKRLRKASDQLIERAGDALVLGSQVDSDYARALTASEQALAGAASLATVTDAVNLNVQSLLSDDLYSDWADDARNAHRRRLIRLLDKQADLAEQNGDIDLAVAALEAAHEVDGTSFNRLRQACALLTSSGREAAADAIARHHGLGAEP